MRKKSKPPVVISQAVGGTAVPPVDGLPPFRRFLDINGKQYGKKTLIRLFFVTPSEEEISATEQAYKSSTGTKMYVMASRMPWMSSGTVVSTPSFDYCQSVGFADDFSEDIVRLLINRFKGRHLGRNSLYNANYAVQQFVRFLSDRNPRPRSITELDKDIWIDYLEFLSKDRRKSFENEFNAVRAVFSSYASSALGGWLSELKVKDGKRRKLAEHTSELAESTRDYSDTVMYQLLALFIFTFEQRIGFLKRYEKVTEKDMPADWIYPGRKKTKHFHYQGSLGDEGRLIEEWLRDTQRGYEIILDHVILYHKLGLVTRKGNASYSSPFSRKLRGYGYRGGEVRKDLYRRFLIAMGEKHGYNHEAGPRTYLDYYVKKKTAGEKNLVMNQTGWCLANLLMMQTGANREVVLTIPSLGENGESILKRGDGIFVRDGQGGETEINLYGTKSKTGNSPEKVIDIIIAKSSPLYQMLCDYERYVKVRTTGPFFEFSKSITGVWSTAVGLADLSKTFPVLNDSGELLKTIQCSRFRKVFASGALLDRMKNVDDMNELANQLRQDLTHGNFDTTLNHYLLKSDVARSIIDIAIATIIDGKLEELKCKSRIETNKKLSFEKKAYLCHCADPRHPSHDVAIAEECRYYDLCLGCEQSIITAEHLPYICLRILQYEEERKKDALSWPAMWEDRWCVAHDALAKYELKDKRNGARLVDEAWRMAREGLVSLPPIMSPSRM